MSIRIESGIPAPKKRTGGASILPPSEFTEALGTMEVDQSFFIRRDTARTTRHVYQWRRLHGMEKDFVIRSERNGCRVWRIE